MAAKGLNHNLELEKEVFLESFIREDIFPTSKNKVVECSNDVWFLTWKRRNGSEQTWCRWKELFLGNKN